MTLITTKDDFHIALNGNGLILQGAPGRIAYSQQQAPTYGQRFASGDRSYNDLSKWWYFAQTDWSGGVKDDVSWEDDATFFASTNIDTWSEPGAVKLTTGLTLENDFSDNVTCGAYISIGGASYPYIGTNDDSGVLPKLYRKIGGSWVELISGFIPSTASAIVDVMEHKNKLWVITQGASGATQYAVFKCDADGSSQTNYAGAIATAMGWTSVSGATAMASDGNTLYVAVEEIGGGARKFGVAKTTDAGTTWTKVTGLDFFAQSYITSMLIVGTNLVYLVESSGSLVLKSYELLDSVDILVQNFATISAVSSINPSSRRMLLPFQGKVVIVVPDKEIWEFDVFNGSLVRLLSRDNFKYNGLSSSVAELSWGVIFPNENVLKGGILHDNKLWFGNLMYDGEYFYNTKKNISDSLTLIPLPVFSDGASIYWVSAADLTMLYVDSGFKGTADKNYVLLNNFDVVSSIDKLLYSVTILFKSLASGQKIVVEYLTGELTNSASFTALGNASFTTDGAITEKKFFFPVGTTYKKIWFRVKLEGDGSTTPTLTDLICEYLPVPTQSKLWNVSVNCADDLERLSGRSVTKTGRELRSLLEVSWWTKAVLDYQDLDYATTTLNNGGTLSSSATTITVLSTVDFPEQGRLVIDDEQMFYTGKTPTTFTGVTRGVRDTKAASHADTSVVNNAYKVIITNLSQQVPVALEGKQLEYVVDIEMREV